LARERAATKRPNKNLDIKEWRNHCINRSLIIVELRFTSDMSFPDTVFRKRDKYGSLIAARRHVGWSVAPLTHVITVGARATVPSRNENVLKELVFVKVADQEAMRRRLAYTAAIHLNIIVWQYLESCARPSDVTILIIYVQPGWVWGGGHLRYIRAETSSDWA
jgi:hypothetical protein